MIELVAEHKRTVRLMQRAHEQLAEDKLLSDREVTRLRRANAALARELRAQRGLEPRAAVIRELLELFVKVHGKSARFNIESGGDRWERVRKWLNHYGRQEIADAFAGVLEPEHSWWPRTLGSKLDVEHVLRRQKDFEAFRDAGYRARTDPPVQIAPAPAAERGWLYATPISRVLGAAHQGVEGGADPGRVVAGADGDSWACRCPAHPDKLGTLSIVRQSNGWVRLTCAWGCTLTEILDAWQLTVPDLYLGAQHDSEAAEYRGPWRVPTHLARDLAEIGQSPSCPADVRQLCARTLDRWLPRLPRSRDADARTGMHGSRHSAPIRRAA